MNILEYENIQETKSHAQDNFPFNIYICSIPLDFAAVPVHWHNAMEIIYIKKGIGTISVDLEPFQVKQGDIVVVLPGQLHAIEQFQNFSMEYENIIFHLSMLMSAPDDICTDKFFQPFLQGQIFFPNYFSQDSPLYSSLACCLNSMDEICKYFPSGYQLAIKSQLFSFFYILIPSMKNMQAHSKNKSLSPLKDILKYVETNYSKKISIADAAKVCGFSKSHFMKYFKSNMSVSFTDYLNDYRLIMASRLLLSSSDTIINIAAEIGFDNLSYFNRIFKKKYHCTPTKFRQQNQETLPSRE